VNINTQLHKEKAFDQYGSSMGRKEYLPEVATRLHLQRVVLDAGGYDRGGAYFGLGQPLYCAFDDEGAVRMYVRAPDRKFAKRAIADKVCVGITFLR
jgi:hypothetical protein